MFERFTARARRSLVIAQEEARLLGHDFIGTEHLVLGLLHEGEGVAALVMKDMGLTVDGLREEVQAIIGPTVGEVGGKLPFTPRSKKVLELSLREALTLGHNYIGTEHLLLAVLREGKGVGAQMLVKHGGSVQNIRSLVIDKLTGYGKQQMGAPPVAPSAPSKAAFTPAVAALIPKAEQLAMGDRVGSHHVLISILDEPDSLAARTLVSFGITREAIAERCAELGTAGTTDEVPEPDPFTLHTFEGGLTIRIEDEELAAKVRSGELTVSFKPTRGDEGGETRSDEGGGAA